MRWQAARGQREERDVRGGRGEWAAQEGEGGSLGWEAQTKSHDARRAVDGVTSGMSGIVASALEESGGIEHATVRTELHQYAREPG
ncbi:hypothetical protein A6V37_37875 [Paraburkholderia ginsengiterrae]|uniref:Uncharacterized protein n=1 Tax=Paraburkholderia ginsengiterrae TaxID=1462993 RepID=A0A1A9NCB4_9BURK|nr:hypothetical protein A6V37_37875 [Paraburkholderia ginsengiterrae]